MRPLSLALVLPLASCAGPVPAASPEPRFDALRFFNGRTRGAGDLSIILRRSRPLTVEGRGRVRSDGTLVLTQRIELGGAPARTRRWEIRRAGPNRYTGTLTDATGPVTGETLGDRLHLAYPSREGRVEQWLTLSPDGRGARNRLTVKRLGVVVARVDETIRKYD